MNKRGNSILFPLALLAMNFCRVGIAQAEVLPEPNAPTTLNEYLYTVTLGNAGLQAAFDSWKAALEQIP